MDEQTLIKKFKIEPYQAQEIISYLQQIGVDDVVFNNIKTVATNFNELSAAIGDSLKNNKNFIIFEKPIEVDIIPVLRAAVAEAGKGIKEISTRYSDGYGLPDYVYESRRWLEIQDNIKCAINYNSLQGKNCVLYFDIDCKVLDTVSELSRYEDGVIFSIIAYPVRTCQPSDEQYMLKESTMEIILKNYDIICFNADFEWLLNSYKKKYADLSEEYPNLDRFLNKSALNSEDFKATFKNASFLEYVIGKIDGYEKESHTVSKYFASWTKESAFRGLDCFPKGKMYEELCSFFTAIGIP